MGWVRDEAQLGDCRGVFRATCWCGLPDVRSGGWFPNRGC